MRSIECSQTDGTEDKVALFFKPVRYGSMKEFISSCKYKATAIPTYGIGFNKKLQEADKYPGRRGKANVIGMGNIILLDIDRDPTLEITDKHTPSEVNKIIQKRNMYKLEEIIVLLDKSGYSYGIYPSRNNGKTTTIEKYRVAIPIEGLQDYLINDVHTYDKLMKYIIHYELGMSISKIDEACFSITQMMESWGYIVQGERFPGAAEWYSIVHDTDKELCGFSIIDEVAKMGDSFSITDCDTGDTVYSNSDELTYLPLTITEEAYQAIKEVGEVRVGICPNKKCSHYNGRGNNSEPVSYKYDENKDIINVVCHSCKMKSGFKEGEFKDER